jgi:hypothetical protein
VNASEFDSETGTRSVSRVENTFFDSFGQPVVLKGAAQAKSR